MLNLTLKGVEVFIERHKNKTQESYWNNYDLIIWKKNSNGFTNTKGLFRKNSWGIAERIPSNDKGIWVLPKKYVKHLK